MPAKKQQQPPKRSRAIERRIQAFKHRRYVARSRPLTVGVLVDAIHITNEHFASMRPTLPAYFGALAQGLEIAALNRLSEELDHA